MDPPEHPLFPILPFVVLGSMGGAYEGHGKFRVHCSTCQHEFVVPLDSHWRSLPTRDIAYTWHQWDGYFTCMACRHLTRVACEVMVTQWPRSVPRSGAWSTRERRRIPDSFWWTYRPPVGIITDLTS